MTSNRLLRWKALITSLAIAASVALPASAQADVVDSFDWPGADSYWEREKNTSLLSFTQTGVFSMVTGFQSTNYAIGNAGHYYRFAPAGAYIYKAEFDGVMHVPNKSVEYGGIWRDDLDVFEAGTWKDEMGAVVLGTGTPANREKPIAEDGSIKSTYCARPGCAEGGTSGNRALFGMKMLGATNNSTDPRVGAGYARLYLSDDQIPGVKVTHSGLPSGWVKSASALQTTVTGSVTTGLGMGTVRIGGAYSTSNSNGCTGKATDGTQPCSFSHSSTFAYGSALGEGNNLLIASATSVAGKDSTAATNPNWNVKIDRTPPAATVNGDGWTGPGGIILPGERSITVAATDDGTNAKPPANAGSGVKRITISVDGVQKFSESQAATADSQAMSRTWSYNTGDYAPGQHKITVTVEDQVGHTWSDSRNVIFTASPELPGEMQGASGQCTEPDAKVVEGYAGSGFVRVIAQRNSSDTWVCWRIDQPGGGRIGGRFKVSDPGGPTGSPGSDESSSACSTTSGNLIPPPHPAAKGTAEFVGPYMVDTYANASAVWVCLQAGTKHIRIKVPVPSGVGTPQVVTELDAPTTVSPDPELGTPGYPSSSCQAAGEGSNRIVNTDIGDTHVWLYKAQPTGSRVDICVRAQGGGLNYGGMLTVDAGPLNPPLPVTTGGDLEGCDPTTGVSNEAPVVVKVHRSNPLGLPASVCVQVGGTAARVTVGMPGSLIQPSIKWRPDPATPIPSIG